MEKAFYILVLLGILAYILCTANGKGKPVRKPFFMPEQVERYYHWCEEFLQPYLGSDFAGYILINAQHQLKSDYKQYRNIPKGPEGKDRYYRYYKDLGTSRYYREWAIVFVRYHLHRGGWSAGVRASDAEVVARDALMKHIDELYAAITAPGSTCPESFIEAFDPSIY